MCTDNPVLIKNTENKPTIICVQHKAEKKVPTEEDLIQSNKLAFNDEIGEVTNRVTSMFEVQAGFKPDSDEYKALSYRIMCGQLYQQNTIDRAKGVIAKPMPANWYMYKENKLKDEDDTETIERKEFYQSIVASRKPYFMTYVYPQLRKETNNYIKNSNLNVCRNFNEYGVSSIQELYALEDKSEEINNYLEYYELRMPVGNNPCTVNKISKYFEKELTLHKLNISDKTNFDADIMKSNVGYSKSVYNKISKLYNDYCFRLKKYAIEGEKEKRGVYEQKRKYSLFLNFFISECGKVCSNEEELCDVLIDICYSSEKTKQFVWDVCGEQVVKNLLKNHENKIYYPKEVEKNGEFSFNGKSFIMQEKIIAEENNDNIE